MAVLLLFVRIEKVAKSTEFNFLLFRNIKDINKLTLYNQDVKKYYNVFLKPMKNKSFQYILLHRVLYLGRDFLRKDIFKIGKKYCKGNVLDIGGRDFFLKAKARGFTFSKWTNIEVSLDEYYPVDDDRYKFIIGDGCNLKNKANTFDTVLNIHVLEHVFEPIKMVKEAARVLKKGGYAIFLIPSAATLHMAPHHYYNFTRFWIEKVMKDEGLKIIMIRSLGGLWQTIAARLFYFFLKSVKVAGMSTDYDKRNIIFYLLLPLTFLYALINIPITLLFSLGDLTEDPNDHLVVVKKVN